VSIYPTTNLARFAWLSIAAAVVTISLKGAAYFLTGSVGLLSDALESVVNLVAAIGALIALTVAARPADEDHTYGYAKAEYFSSGFEGGLILLAAVSIVATAIPRLIHPEGITDAGLGLAISTVASAINGVVAWRLLRVGRRHRSITLEADGKHLMTDVATSIGVLLGVGAVVVTGWDRLDPLIALAVAANIIWTGVGLVRGSMMGLLDTAISRDDRTALNAVLERHRAEHGIQIHAIRTRQAGARCFASFHVIVPGDWTVRQGHALLESMEQDVRQALSCVTVSTHLEALDDPLSWADTQLDRDDGQEATQLRGTDLQA
jgi:cation diffusion facilitator family transporter